MKILLRIIIYAVAIALVSLLLPGINVINNDAGTLLLLGLVIGIVNTIVRPAVLILSCPFILLSMGILLPVINGLMLMLAASIVGDRMTIDGLGSAILGGLIMMVVVIMLEGALGLREDDEKARRQDEDVVIIKR